MNSMTGFGRGKLERDGLEVVVEINSVNRKTLDINVSLPKEWQALERSLVEQVRSDLNRGAVRVTVIIESLPGEDELLWDDKKVKGTLDRLMALARERGVEPVLDMDTLFRVAVLHRSESALPDAESAAILLRDAAALALKEFKEMRALEGSKLVADLRERIARLNAILADIAVESANTVSNYRENLMSRLRQAGLELNLDDERVLKEIALFADRADTSEEQTRLASHLAQLEDTLSPDQAEPVGRKLEFIIQEVNREFNTVGSKANNIAISKLVIEAKNEIERIREQVQNLE